MILQKTENVEVTLDGKWKRLRSDKLNYDFDMTNGNMGVWGKTFQDDPDWSPYGPFILDFEVTTKCKGVAGKLCPYCYKSNTPNGKNTLYEDFVKVIEKVNFNKQLTQVAFGLDAAAEANPDLWRMCAYLRDHNIIPNGTVAELEDKTAVKIAELFGAVAVSYHNDWNVLCDTVKKLSDARRVFHNATLKQINIHFMLSEETYEDCFELIEMAKTDERLKDLNAIVLLGLKQCGRAETGFHPVRDVEFKTLMFRAFELGVGIGFDSCSANRFIRNVEPVLNELKKIKPDINVDQLTKQYTMLAEPCESMLFSSYVNSDGDFYPCSFNEKNEPAFNVVNGDFEKMWTNYDSCNKWRERLLKCNRSCPNYEV
jgi:MoaA/NifB/PqqE/SkfB family radical SAM enzyme